MKRESRPVIGILTVPGSNDGLRPLFRENERFGNLLYRFSPHDILFRERQIRGYMLTRRGAWKRGTFPWPDVVIDKSLGGEEQIYQSIRRKSIFRFLEAQIGGKWEIHRTLWRVKELRPFLPETYSYSSHTFKRMLRKYPVLYVKPTDGTWGLGILKIQRVKGGYLVVARDMGKGIPRLRIPENKILPWVNRWVGHSPFVIQQGLDLTLLPGKVMDMRVLIQKNGQGQWSITGQGMRIGGKKSPISNLHGGGRGRSVKSILGRIFGSNRVNHLLHQSHQVSHAIAHTIEKKYGRMMELGLDFGIDTKGRLWIIEVNDMPGRTIFRHMGREDLFQKANRKPLLYAMYVVKNGIR